MSITTTGAITSIEVSRNGKQITTSAGSQVTFYDTNTFNPIKYYILPQELNSVSLHPNTSRFVVGGTADFYAHVYDYNTGKELEIHKGHHGPVHCVRYAPDGETFATGSEDGTVRIWQNENKPYGLWQPGGRNPGHFYTDVALCIVFANFATSSVLFFKHISKLLNDEIHF